MNKEVLIGKSEPRDILITPKNGTLISEINNSITANKAVILHDVETVDKDNGEITTYDTMILITDNGLIRVPNKVAIETIKKFVNECKEAGYMCTTITIKAIEVKSESGNKYIDVIIEDFTYTE